MSDFCGKTLFGLAKNKIEIAARNISIYAAIFVIIFISHATLIPDIITIHAVQLTHCAI